MAVLFVVCTAVNGMLWRTPLVTDGVLSPSVSSELMSPPAIKAGKRWSAIAAIDAVQLAMLGVASERDTGNNVPSSLLHLVSYRVAQ